MQAIKSTAIALNIILISGFGSITFAKEVKTNSDILNSPNVEKNLQTIKTPQKETTSQQKGICRRFPYCR